MLIKSKIVIYPSNQIVGDMIWNELEPNIQFSHRSFGMRGRSILTVISREASEERIRRVTRN